MKSVIVFMSTYNPTEYFDNQITSILQQVGVQVFLNIRDDGSAEEPKKRLLPYTKYNNVQIIMENNIGAANSFMKQLYDNDYRADYYAFADQDDIWEKEKLVRAIECLEREDASIPLLYCSNQTITNSSGEVQRLRYYSTPTIDLANVIYANKVAGCTMVFNDILNKVLIQPDHRPTEFLLRLRMHDVWVIAVAGCVGKVIYDPNSYMLYRQHENNLVGVRTIGIKKRIWNGIIFYRQGKINYRSSLAKELLQCFGDDLEQEKREILDLYISSSNLGKRLKKIFSPQIKNIACNSFMFRLKLLLGLL